jgi:hypothetical protein
VREKAVVLVVLLLGREVYIDAVAQRWASVFVFKDEDLREAAATG